MKKELANKLKTIDFRNKKMVLGFDGFIDEIIHAVDKRLDTENFTRIETILDFAKRVERASGLSTNIELFPVDLKIGGNGPIMCNALAMHESDITYIGALGVPNIHEVFNDMPKNAKLYSIANSGHSDAIEFHDGKLILGKMSSLSDLNYENIIKVVGINKLVQLLDETELFAAVNWSMIPYMTSIWKNLLTDICPKLSKKLNKPIFFVDLADPEKREGKEIKEALDLLKEFKPYFKVVLGLNKKEAYDVAKVLKLIDSDVSLKEVNEKLYHYLEIDVVVIHPVDRSCAVYENKFYEDFGPLAKKPKLTTGAGDNFNSGFMFGLMLGLTTHEALLLGMSTSGFYVRNAKSPNYMELITFLEMWEENKLD